MRPSMEVFDLFVTLLKKNEFPPWANGLFSSVDSALQILWRRCSFLADEFDLEEANQGDKRKNALSQIMSDLPIGLKIR